MVVPEHLGIVMDGNGRWAQAQGLERTKGHVEGLKVARRITRAASEAGVKYLSLYVFSTELGLKVVHSGDREALSPEVRRTLARVMKQTAHHTGMTINLVLNHGGRDEIVRAVNRWTKAATGRLFSAGDLRKNLDVPELPDLDLMIRTGGEMRLSNFLLWQAAYAEFVFSPKLWPDFSEADLLAAFREFASRGRRFGAIPGVIPPIPSRLLFN